MSKAIVLELVKRIRFGTRTWLAFTFVTGLILWGFTNQYFQVANQNRRLEAIAESGGKYIIQSDSSPIINRISIFSVFDYKSVRQVWGPLDTGVSLEFIMNAIQLPELESLSIGDSSVTDNHLQVIVDWDQGTLRHLNLWGSRVTDNGLRKLAQIPTLTLIDISFCPQITDEGILRFQELRPSIQINRE